MEIFSKRYFLWIATAFLAFSAFAFFLKIEYVALLLLMLLIGLALIVVLNWEKRKMLFSLSVILIFAAFLGFFNSFNFASGQEAIKERYCGESYVCGYVNEVTRKGDFSSEYLVTIERIDGEEVSLSAILSSDYDAELRRGDFFEASATVLDIDECREELFISNKYDAPLVCRVSAEQGITS